MNYRLIKIRTIKDTIQAYAWWIMIAVKSKARKRFGKERSKNHHVALLAWHFPPSVDGGVYRSLAIAKYGAAIGWKISVISKRCPEPHTASGKYLSDDIPRGVKMRQVDTPKLQPSYTCFPRINGGFTNVLAMFSVAVEALIGDPPSIVMASGPPFHSFVAAYYIANYFRAKLVLDYRDEWTECPFSFVEIGNVDRRWEKRCIEKADAIFFTTQSQLEHQVASFSRVDTEKFKVIPNGWEPRDFINPVEPKIGYLGPDVAFILSFIGNLSDHTLPDRFLYALKSVLSRSEDLRSRIRVRFVGKKSEEAMEQLLRFPYKNNLDIIGHVPKNEANLIMRLSSALLVINNEKFSRYLPGKLYDYIAAGRPVLVFGEGGEIAELIKKLNAGVIVPADSVAMFEKAVRSLMGHSSADDYSAFRKNLLSISTREKMAQKMIKVFNELVAKIGQGVTRGCRLQKD